MPPEWLTGWLQFLLVQVVGLVGLGIGVWKWLTKPLRTELKQCQKRIKSVKSAFKKDSFDIRTELTKYMGKAYESEQRLNLMEHKLEGLQSSADRVEQSLSTGLREIRDRLTTIETEVRIRVEQSQRREGDDKR